MAKVPVLENIVRQHAEMAAFLWTAYDNHMLHPDEDPDMNEERLADLIERLEAHLDGLRVAGSDGLTIAEQRYADFPEAGELFVVRMLQPGARALLLRDLELQSVRAFIAAHTGR